MQNWICIYCGELYLEPHLLIDHIFKDHQGDMTRPENLIVLTAAALIQKALKQDEVSPASKN